MGHRVEAVANGAEAIRVLRTVPYDLVLMDVQMPEMDGIEATRRIRDADTGVRNPRIPIVAMTAHAMKGDRERCLEAGMNDYLSKPIDPQEVADAIARWTSAETRSDVEFASGVPAASPAGSSGGAGIQPCPAPTLDRATLLARLGGDEDVFAEVIQIFLEDVPRQLRGMEDALTAGDAPTLRRLAHSLKGSSGTVGAEAMQQASQALEQATASGDLAAARPLVRTVKDMSADVFDTMRRWLVDGNTR